MFSVNNKIILCIQTQNVGHVQNKIRVRFIIRSDTLTMIQVDKRIQRILFWANSENSEIEYKKNKTYGPNIWM